MQYIAYIYIVVMLYYTVGYNNYTTNNIGDKQNESKREDQHKERIKHY